MVGHTFLGCNLHCLVLRAPAKFKARRLVVCVTSQERGRDEAFWGTLLRLRWGRREIRPLYGEVDDRGRQRPDTREEDQEQTIYPRTPIVPPPSLSPQV